MRLALFVFSFLRRPLNDHSEKTGYSEFRLNSLSKLLWIMFPVCATL
jgi:hypothetical protein